MGSQFMVYSVGGVQVQNCGTEGADATYCQDECGGIEFTDSSVDKYTYRYYFTGEQGDLGTLPMYPRPDGAEKYYPYTIKCYRGYANGDDSQGEAGTTNDFEPVALEGYTDPHPTVCQESVSDEAPWDCTEGVTTVSISGTSYWGNFGKGTSIESGEGGAKPAERTTKATTTTVA